MAYVLYHCGMNPTAVIGGKVINFESNARSGEGDYIVFEADESDGTFLNLFPTIGVVTNIDADHLDHYKYFEGLKDAFLKYINNIPFYGFSALCIDDNIIRELLPLVERPYFTYGFSDDADFRADSLEFTDVKTKFTAYFKNSRIGDFEINLLGKHNVLNSIAVIAVAMDLGLEYEAIRGGLSSFSGVGRRIEKIGEGGGIAVYDDYGHHPTEVRATLEAIKKIGRRVIVIFQPHRYSRTELLWDDFGQSFSNADELFLTEIYPAGEKPIEGVSSKLIQEAVLKHEGRNAEIISRFEDIPARVLARAKRGDLILTLGAGDIYKAGRKILDEIGR
jgi:UDP-N-acetylmuramate--alanine ligase